MVSHTRVRRRGNDLAFAILPVSDPITLIRAHTIRSGTTISSYSASERYPSARAASFSVVPS